MRFIEFTEVILRQAGETQIQMIHMPIVLIAENIIGVAPGAIPSEIRGPQGNPTSTEAAYIIIPGGRILVTSTIEEAEWKIANESKEIKKPELKEQKKSKIIS